MNIEDIITLEDNKEYLILDIVEYNNDKYMYCVGMDKDENPTNEYIYVKSILENNEYYTEEIEDKELLETIQKLFVNNYINEYKNDEQDV